MGIGTVHKHNFAIKYVGTSSICKVPYVNTVPMRTLRVRVMNVSKKRVIFKQIMLYMRKYAHFYTLML